jgi:hypothetical protein
MSKNTKTDSDQHRRFIETAHALECDENKERFEDKLGKIAAAKPPPNQKPKVRRPRRKAAAR